MQDRNLTILLILTAILYLPSLWGDFVFDDHYLIRQNAVLHSSGALEAAFSRDYYGMANPQYALGYYRPLSLVTHWLDWQIWGASPWGHHLTNLILHLAVCAILYLLLISLFQDPSLAFLASTLFAIHPAHAATVTFISGRVDVIATLFVLLALLCVIKKNPAGPAFYFAGLLSKEISVTLPVLVFWKKKEEGGSRAAFQAMVPYAIVLLLVIVMRWAVLGAPRSQMLSLTFDSLQRTFISLLAYLRFLVLPPLDLYIEPSPNNIALVPAIGATVLFLVGAFFLRNKRIAIWSCLWLVTLIPVLGIFKLETGLDERFLYLPSIAFCLLAAGWILQYLQSRSSEHEVKQKHLIIAALLIAVLYAPLLLSRQACWRNDLALWRSAVKTDPYTGHVRLRLGAALMQAGLLTEAEQQFMEGLALPAESAAYSAALCTHLATVRIMQNKDQDVEKLYKRSLELQPHYFTAHLNFGLYYKMKNRPNEAIAEFQEAIRSNPNSGAAHKELAQQLIKVGGHEMEAQEHFRLAAELGAR